MSVDPWIYTGYLSTSGDGSATYAACVKTGNLNFEDKPFIMHAADGSRVACGLLQAETDHASAKKTSTGYGTRQTISWTILVIGIVTVLYTIIV